MWELLRHFELAAEMAEYLSKALKQAANEASVLLYASGMDSFFEDLVKDADRVLYFQETPATEADAPQKPPGF